MEKQTMEANRQRYTRAELQEFEALILDKLQAARKELAELKGSISSGEAEPGSGTGSLKTVEDGAGTMEKEHLNQLAARAQKYVVQLEKALIRIKNGTYGVCIKSGNLIPRERLMLVPHTQHSIEAKLSRN